MRAPARSWLRTALLAAPLFACLACNTVLRFPRGTVEEAADDAVLAGETLLDKDPTVKALAHDLDHLEQHIDCFGSVTAKSPDVWGQARLTQYREQFEQEMAKDLSTFKLTLQGSLARSDQAYYESAMTLSAAIQPRPPLVGRVISSKTTNNPPLSPTEVVTTTTTQQTQPGGDSVNTVKKVTEGPPPPKPTDPVKPLEPGDPSSLVTGLDTLVSRNAVTSVTNARIGFGDLKTGGITLEPTLMLAQKKRYLDFLNQLRRENEGDDTADAPGYSLNLVRIPVSLLPGKKTDQGYGAEATVTLSPILGEDLLPRTFRTLVSNDLIAQIGVPLTTYLGDAEVTGFLTADNKLLLEGIDVINRINALLANTEQLHAYLRGLNEVDQKRLRLAATHLSEAQQKALAELLKAAQQGGARSSEAFALAAQRYGEAGKGQPLSPLSVLRQPGQELSPFEIRLALPSLSFSSGLQNKLPFPTSQLLDNYGVHESFEIAYGAKTALSAAIKRQGYAHLPDVQSFLKEEIDAAWGFLAAPECQPLWQRFCTPELVNAVRTRKLEQLRLMREDFREAVAVIAHTSEEMRRRHPYLELVQHSKSAALAWCILVDSALLNDRLIRDMREVATAKGQPLHGCDGWQLYFLPDPPPEARAAFNEYVNLRWPIHVFALDPVTQDQNLADSLSTRREMQLALSIAFTNGIISSRVFRRYVRRLEAEYETIALNRTQVGFSHGENVFGWRFYPRFQTPDTPGNLEVFTRDLLIGGPNRDALLRQRRLEPGMRECVAIVLMPSFVPYVTADVVGNWFPLTNPKHKALNHSQAMKLSHSVKLIQTKGCALPDADDYRDGDAGRLLRRAEQLSSRLPLQTLTVQVPVINTLGGFAMFNNGVTDFAPELYGWYGAPGVDPLKTTTLFLVGDHFSPLHTEVIVGNAKAQKWLLSRQVMKVEIPPAGVIPLAKEVRIHVATPYGVTRELAVPLVVPPVAVVVPPPAAGYDLDPRAVTVKYVKLAAGKDTYHLGVTGLVPADSEVKVKWTDGLGTAPGKIKVVLEFAYNKCPFEVTLDGPFAGSGGKYVLAAADLQQVAKAWTDTVNRFGPFTDAINPAAADVTTTAIKVVPLDAGRDVVPVKVPGKLTFSFQCSLPAWPAPAAAAPPAEAVPCPAPPAPVMPPANAPPAATLPAPVNVPPVSPTPMDTLPPPVAVPKQD